MHAKGVNDFIYWRMFLYEAEMVVCVVVVLSIKFRNYYILAVTYVLYFAVWIAGIVNIIYGMVVYYNSSF